MRYMLLIYGNEAVDASQTPEEMETMMAEYNAFTNEVRDRGLLLGGDALVDTSAATTVRVRDSQILTTDGPFAETKEQLGGYYMLNCDNLDEAIEMAAKIPGAKNGSVEIRPIMEFE
ncbi:MAG: YciI family protein [Anaerolineales bacterium]|nr:YciI family protein [Anaerolineales bacterium]MCB0004961.1 YciI family protein [Anaerolineales bacterium]MCB0016553.1 YciI family protein [Anaerolineales bacterium]MCB8962118.1 YciI family protein [Ardenticatenales bacterium]